MARHPDPDLEGRILKEARKLWKKGAEDALTMRAVARAARTNTPALYRRFATRDDILRALLEQTRQEVFQQARESTSVEDFCERYVAYAVSHPREYELFYLKEYELFHAGKKADGPLKETLRQKRPIVQFMTSKLAAQLPGVTDDRALQTLSLSLWAVIHGSAMLLIAKTILPQHAEEMRSACRAAVEALIRGTESMRDQKK